MHNRHQVDYPLYGSTQPYTQTMRQGNIPEHGNETAPHRLKDVKPVVGLTYLEEEEEGEDGHLDEGAVVVELHGGDVPVFYVVAHYEAVDG